MTAAATPRQIAIPSALPAEEMAAAVERGAVVVDIRSRAQRARQGVLPGALAVDPRDATELVDPTGPGRLAAVGPATEVLVVSDDGLDAEVLAMEVGGHVRPVAGGFAALSAAGALRALAGARHLRREGESIAAH